MEIEAYVEKLEWFINKGIKFELQNDVCYDMATLDKLFKEKGIFVICECRQNSLWNDFQHFEAVLLRQERKGESLFYQIKKALETLQKNQ